MDLSPKWATQQRKGAMILFLASIGSPSFPYDFDPVTLLLDTHPKTIPPQRYLHIYAFYDLFMAGQKWKQPDVHQQINKYKNVLPLRILFIPQENEICKKNGCNVFLEMSITIFKGSSPNLKEHDLYPEPCPAQSQAPCIDSCLWLLALGSKSSREGLGSCL